MDPTKRTARVTGTGSVEQTVANEVMVRSLLQQEVFPTTPEAKLSQQVFEQLPALRRYARFLVHDLIVADDLVYSCLSRIVAQRCPRPPQARLRAWLFLALRGCFNESCFNETHYGSGPGLPASLSQQATQEPSALPDPSAQTAAMMRSVSMLSVAQREVLLFAVVENMTCSEVSSLLSIPIATVQWRPRHATRSAL